MAVWVWRQIKCVHAFCGKWRKLCLVCVCMILLYIVPYSMQQFLGPLICPLTSIETHYSKINKVDAFVHHVCPSVTILLSLPVIYFPFQFGFLTCSVSCLFLSPPLFSLPLWSSQFFLLCSLASVSLLLIFSVSHCYTIIKIKVPVAVVML